MFFRREFHPLVRYLLGRGFEEQAAADAAQEAMHTAFEQWSEIVTPAAWVRTVALRTAGHGARGEASRSARDRTYAVRSPLPQPPDPAQVTVLGEEQQSVLKRIRGLSPACRNVVALVFDGFSSRDIARELDIAEATVRSHIRHARRALDDRLPQIGGDL
jgi:RNA polymerase sigma-70 factor (ECF subfamily)